MSNKDELYDLARKWHQIADNEAVAAGTQHGYRECANQLDAHLVEHLLADTFSACGFEALPNGDIRLWIGGTDGANSEPLSDDQLESLIKNLTHVMQTRGQWNLTWAVPANPTN